MLVSARRARRGSELSLTNSVAALVLLYIVYDLFYTLLHRFLHHQRCVRRVLLPISPRRPVAAFARCLCVAVAPCTPLRFGSSLRRSGAACISTSTSIITGSMRLAAATWTR